MSNESKLCKTRFLTCFVSFYKKPIPNDSLQVIAKSHFFDFGFGNNIRMGQNVSVFVF